MAYVKDMEEELKNARTDRVFITHSGCTGDITDEVRTYLKSLNIFEEILETRAGGVTAVPELLEFYLYQSSKIYKTIHYSTASR